MKDEEISMNIQEWSLSILQTSKVDDKSSTSILLL